MKIAEKARGGYHFLALALVINAAFIMLGIASFNAGSGYRWLLKALPIWAVIEALLIGCYFWALSKRTITVKTKSARREWRANWWLALYLVASVAAASITRTFFPTRYEAIYSAVYWTTLGVSLLTLFWFFVLSKPNVVHGRYARQIVIAFLLMISFASGPLIVILINAREVSTIIGVIGVVWITPVLLWELQLYPFKPQPKKT